MFLKKQYNVTPQFTIMGRFSDIVASWRSLEEIVRRADVILPGQDSRALDAEVYPIE